MLHTTPEEIILFNGNRDVSKIDMAADHTRNI